MCPRPAFPTIDERAYVIGAEIARGGGGRILRALDRRRGYEVALKELLTLSEITSARFAREVSITSHLSHPAIVNLYDRGTWSNGTPFFTMRMVDGRTLRDRLAATTSMRERLALIPALLHAIDGIAFAHDAGVVHRDLSPANLLIEDRGRAVVIDWGLAKRLCGGDTEAEALLTAPGTVLGTLAYMPLEQARAETVDQRADVYALGAILYHVIAGRPPYVGRPIELLNQLYAGAPESLDASAPDAPRALVAVVMKAMARDAANRHGSARELAAELRAALGCGNATMSRPLTNTTTSTSTSTSTSTTSPNTSPSTTSPNTSPSTTSPSTASPNTSPSTASRLLVSLALCIAAAVAGFVLS